MKRQKKPLQELSLVELIQEIQVRASTEAIAADQQQALIQTMMCLLQSYAKSIQRPLPEQDIREIRGQAHVKRVLEIAAAGGHNVLLVGPPGAGKAQLARTLPSLLPTTALPYPLREPPSRIESEAFIGSLTLPGELALAHGGVLLLKDLNAFDLPLLTVLAHTVETQAVTLPLQEENVALPAKFILGATIQSCPCGFSGDLARKCFCLAEEVAHYRQRITEIVRRCFALEVQVPLVREDLFPGLCPEENSADVRRRVELAHTWQQRRYAETLHLRVNADLRTVDEVQLYCRPVSDGEDLLKSAIRQVHLTPQEIVRVQTVARTIADLERSSVVTAPHLAEAMQYLSRFIRNV